MSKKYHLTEKGWLPCNANFQCPIAGEHYDTEKDAAIAFEKRMNNEHITVVNSNTKTSIKELNNESLHDLIEKEADNISFCEYQLEEANNLGNKDYANQLTGELNKSYALYDDCVEELERRDFDNSRIGKEIKKLKNDLLAIGDDKSRKVLEIIERVNNIPDSKFYDIKQSKEIIAARLKTGIIVNKDDNLKKYLPAVVLSSNVFFDEFNKQSVAHSVIMAEIAKENLTPEEYELLFEKLEELERE